ncbi:MAG: fatty acid desaturase, partial [Anaerolineae bacterium]|nr:fatty acid desaturase [Anaerolineae bacterium]
MKEDARGVWIGLLIFGLWAVSLVGLLALPVSPTSWILLPLGTVWMAFLYTGLFITAHDAIHGAVWPHHRDFNRWVGQIILFLYALFPYKKIREAHFQHHRTPGRPDDPDYHDGQHRGFLRWYLHFMVHYLTLPQLVGMALIFNLLRYGAGVPLRNVMAFWAGPALLSTLQLFAFGTYLTHREPPAGYTNRHHAQTSTYPKWLSFLTCYHFGYHLEHHLYPNVP